MIAGTFFAKKHLISYGIWHHGDIGKAYMVRFADEKIKIVRLNKDNKDDDGNKPTFDFLRFTHYKDLVI